MRSIDESGKTIWVLFFLLQRRKQIKLIVFKLIGRIYCVYIANHDTWDLLGRREESR